MALAEIKINTNRSDGDVAGSGLGETNKILEKILAETKKGRQGSEKQSKLSLSGLVGGAGGAAAGGDLKSFLKNPLIIAAALAAGVSIVDKNVKEELGVESKEKTGNVFKDTLSLAEEEFEIMSKIVGDESKIGDTLTFTEELGKKNKDWKELENSWLFKIVKGISTIFSLTDEQEKVDEDILKIKKKIRDQLKEKIKGSTSFLASESEGRLPTPFIGSPSAMSPIPQPMSTGEIASMLRDTTVLRHLDGLVQEKDARNVFFPTSSSSIFS